MFVQYVYLAVVFDNNVTVGVMFDFEIILVPNFIQYFFISVYCLYRVLFCIHCVYYNVLDFETIRNIVNVKCISPEFYALSLQTNTFKS